MLSSQVLLLSLPSGMEWIWIVLVVIILFGGRKIPELARGLGKGIRDFNDAKDGIKKEIESGMDDSTTNGKINQSSKFSESQKLANEK